VDEEKLIFDRWKRTADYYERVLTSLSPPPLTIEVSDEVPRMVAEITTFTSLLHGLGSARVIVRVDSPTGSDRTAIFVMTEYMRPLTSDAKLGEFSLSPLGLVGFLEVAVDYSRFLSRPTIPTSTWRVEEIYVRHLPVLAECTTIEDDDLIVCVLNDGRKLTALIPTAYRSVQFTELGEAHKYSDAWLRFMFSKLR
jgi:hypothetical protein